MRGLLVVAALLSSSCVASPPRAAGAEIVDVPTVVHDLPSGLRVALETDRSPDCVAFQSDQKVRVLATGRATYPDATLVCGPIQGDPADPQGSTITNPTLLVEVLSPSTEQEDRGNKWQHYQLVPSLQEYVIVGQQEPSIERYRRLPDGSWQYSKASEGSVELSCGAVLDLGKLYERLPD